MTLEDMKEEYGADEAGSQSQLSLPEGLEKEIKELEMEKNRMLNESFQYVEMLEKIALNVEIAEDAHSDYSVGHLYLCVALSDQADCNSEKRPQKHKPCL